MEQIGEFEASNGFFGGFKGLKMMEGHYFMWLNKAQGNSVVHSSFSVFIFDKSFRGSEM